MTRTTSGGATRAHPARLRRSVALAGAALLLGATAASAVGTNGGFEVGPEIRGGFDTYPDGSTAITGWTVTGDSVDYVGTHWAASDGEHSIDLNGLGPGGIEQTIATTVGSTYTVTFDMSGNPDGYNELKTLDLSATGAAPESFSFEVTDEITHAAMGYEFRQYVFTATQTSTALRFSSTTMGDALRQGNGPVIDDVVILETLPQAADCKKGGWENMIDVTGNAFKNQGDCVSHFATGGKNLGDG